MKIKFLSKVGKNEVGTIADFDEIKAKSYLEDGLAEAVAPSAEDTAIAGLTARINEIASDVATKAATQAIANVTKGFASNKIVVHEARELQDPTGGYKSMTHFLMDVKRSGDSFQNPTATMTKYLHTEALRAKTAGATPAGTEGTPSLVNGEVGDGAAIPVEYLGEIVRMYGEQADYASMCLPIQMNSLAAHVPVVRNYDRSNATATAGIVAGEAGEGNVIPTSKLNWEQRLLTLVVESIMAPVSNETLSDNNVNWGTVVAAQAVYQLRKRINGGILNGKTTSCTGLLGSSGTTGTGVHAGTKIVGRTTAGTIAFGDILNIFAAFDHEGADYNNAIWVGNPGVVAPVYNSTIGSFPAMLAPGAGSKENPKPLSILGRPLYLTGYGAALGTTGDLSLIDFKQVLFGYKGGIDSFVSPHVFCTSNQTGFRFTQRVNAQPLRTGLVTLEDGSTKVSSTVTLGAVGGLS